jgi:hypothetical protein
LIFSNYGAQAALQVNFNSTAIGGLVMAAAMFFAGWFHSPKVHQN